MGKDWTDEVKLPDYGIPKKVVSGKELADNYVLLETLGSMFSSIISRGDSMNS